MLREVTTVYGNVRVDVVPRACWWTSAGPSRPGCVVKGLRAVSDFDYELQMAQMNIGLAGVETLFMPTNPEYSFLSSSLVKDVAKWGGDVSPHVPDVVRQRLRERLRPGPEPRPGGRRTRSVTRRRARRASPAVRAGRSGPGRGEATVGRRVEVVSEAGVTSGVGRATRRPGPVGPRRGRTASWWATTRSDASSCRSTDERQE